MSAFTLSDVSIAILSRDKPQFIRPLLDALAPLTVEILVGDTGSSDQSVLSAYQTHGDRIRLISDLDYHFSANNNVLAANANRPVLLFLNNDIIFGDVGRNLDVSLAALSGAMIVGPRLAYPDGSLQHGGIDLIRQGASAGQPYHPGHGGRIPAWPIGASVPMPAVTGAALMIRANDFKRLGGYDEAYDRECQDVALCLSARRLGGQVLVVEAGAITHVENGTRQKGEADAEDRARLLRHFGAAAQAGIV